MTWTETQLQTARELVAIAQKYGGIPRLLLLGVCLQESGLEPGADNASDPEGSFGPFQLNQVAHPGTAFLATDAWYDYGYPEVRARWEASYASLGGDSAWAGDTSVVGRGNFLAQFAPTAQGSIAWPVGLGQTRYIQAIDVLEAIS